ncbi:Arginyl-tRNA--protein transferase 1 [Coemansia sp. RSA 720]|nr:Arginyl-tRNA--protein transferase 1 [Coemansia sp. RSA 720]
MPVAPTSDTSNVSDLSRRRHARAEQTQLQILGMQRRSRCGYCRTPAGSCCFGARTRLLRCADYQVLIDRGWRRSGSLLYLTDHSSSCCAYYSIRTHALSHTLQQSEKKLLRKWRRWELLGDSAPDSALDSSVVTAGRRLVVRLEPAAYSEEKFHVFERYQRAVHNDMDASRSGFQSFLCSSPLLFEDTANGPTSGRLLSHGLGSYHQCYYVDGRLAAVGVIDVLPTCVSSVYLFYDPEFSDLSLGTYSSLREIALVRELNQYVSPDIKYYYMGYFIPSCPKMTYKARWRPAELLDLVTFAWIPIDQCLERIRQHPAFCTFDPRINSRNIVRNSRRDVLSWAPAISPCTLSDGERRAAMQLVFWIGPRNSVLASNLACISKELEQVVWQTVASLGLPLASRAILSI